MTTDDPWVWGQPLPDPDDLSRDDLMRLAKQVLKEMQRVNEEELERVQWMRRELEVLRHRFRKAARV